MRRQTPARLKRLVAAFLPCQRRAQSVGVCARACVKSKRERGREGARARERESEREREREKERERPHRKMSTAVISPLVGSLW